MKIARVAAIASLFMAANLFGGTYRDEMVRLSGLLYNKDYTTAIAEYKVVLKDPALPRFLQAAGHFDLGFAYFSSNQVDMGLAAFDKSVQLGFDDFIAVHEQDVFKSLYGNARFREIYGRMRISPADVAELYWLRSEISAVIHDMKMMITENIGRIDEEYTEVPQSKIPARATSSVGVLTQREVLAIIQTMQINNVRESDISRKNHLMQMDIISRMPSGGGRSADVDQQEKLRLVQESMRQARERARQRWDAIGSRSFVVPAGATATPLPCPALGSIHPPSIN